MMAHPIKCLAASLLLLVALFSGKASAWATVSVPHVATRTSFAKTTGVLFSSPGGDDSAVHKGTVKWFDTTKGFGFIVPSDGSPDVFVHQSEIQMQGFRSLADGENVEFNVQVDPKSGRRKAVQVTGPDGADVQGAPFKPTSDYDSY